MRWCWVGITIAVIGIVKGVGRFQSMHGFNVNIDKTKAKIIGSSKYRTDYPYGLE